MEIARGESGIALNQRKYALDLVSTAGLLGRKGVSTPLPSGIKLVQSSDSLLSDPEPYRQLVGKLLYLNLTRPDLSYSVQQLSRFVSRPSTAHWEAALRVLRYLKTSPSLGLFYGAHTDFCLRGYSDADLGACLDSRKAKYRSLSTTTRELQWVVSLMRDFGCTSTLPIPLYCDNQAAIHITKNHVFHERTKNLDIDCHLVREKYKASLIFPMNVSSTL